MQARGRLTGGLQKTQQTQQKKAGLAKAQAEADKVCVFCVCVCFCVLFSVLESMCVFVCSGRLC